MEQKQREDEAWALRVINTAEKEFCIKCLNQLLSFVYWRVRQGQEYQGVIVDAGESELDHEMN